MTNAELISMVRSIAKHGADWRINEVLNRAADALEAAEKRIEELMPKGGEWEERYIEDANPMFRRRFYCSRCGDWTTHGKTRYCPNCGAKMKGEHDEQID